MKVEFDSNGCLIVFAENNTDKVALKAFIEADGSRGYDLDGFEKTIKSKSIDKCGDGGKVL